MTFQVSVMAWSILDVAVECGTPDDMGLEQLEEFSESPHHPRCLVMGVCNFSSGGANSLKFA